MPKQKQKSSEGCGNTYASHRQRPRGNQSLEDPPPLPCLMASRRVFTPIQSELADCFWIPTAFLVCQHVCYLMCPSLAPPPPPFSKLLKGRVCVLLIFVTLTVCLACSRCSVSVPSISMYSQSFCLSLEKLPSLCSLSLPSLSLQPLTWPSKIPLFIYSLGGRIYIKSTSVELGRSRFKFWL